MGHRAEKTYLRHGFHTQVTTGRTGYEYMSERPGYVKKKAGPNKGSGYKGITQVGHKKPKRDKWTPRHRNAAANA